MEAAAILHLDGLSNVGNRRTNNEDAWWAGQSGGASASIEAPASGTLRLDPAAGPVVAIVSDGVGGANAGEVASQIAVATVSRALHEERGRLGDPRTAREAVLAAVRATDAAVVAKAAEPGFNGMGATLSLLCFPGGRVAWWAQVGDSRIYLCRRGRMHQLSLDHSPVGRMRQEGRISEEEARRHPMRNQIDQSLGDPGRAFRPDVAAVELEPDDVFLLCSDGLSDGLWDREIEPALAGIRGPADVRPAVQRLVDGAAQASGRDNITAVIGFVELPRTAGAPGSDAGLGQRLRRWWRGSSPR